MGPLTNEDARAHPTDGAAELREALHRAEQRERALIRDRDEVRRLLSHDVKSPLGFITGMAELMLMGQYGPLSDQARRMLSEMLRQGERLADTLDQVVLTHRLQAGELQLRLGDVDLPKLLHSVAEQTESDATERGLGLTVRASADAPRARADRRMLERLVTNLVLIAVRVGSSGGGVVLELARNSSGPRIAVTLDGQVAAGGFSEDLDGWPDGDALPAVVNLQLRYARLAAELHGGSLGVAQRDDGMELVVTLPRR